MAGKSSRARDGRGESVLAAALEPHLDALSEAAQIREAIDRELAERAARAARRRLDEAELMALIFEHLDHENPRVCEGIDFDRLIVLSDRDSLRESLLVLMEGRRRPSPTPGGPVVGPPPTRSPLRGSCSARVEGAPLPNEHDSRESAELAIPPSPPSVDPSAWIGQSWADDIRAILPELLDRPELDERQRSLLVRAPRRELACVNLRRLARARALAHLELFVGVCRAERVRFCRVISGKGIDSRAEPVIKRAVIEWCRDGDAVLGWAPEIDRHGEWGAMILELRALRA